MDILDVLEDKSVPIADPEDIPDLKDDDNDEIEEEEEEEEEEVVLLKPAKRRTIESSDDEAPSKPRPTSSKPSTAASENDEDGPATKKRRTLFAPVKKNSKCGVCDSCLNPHWKKACTEVRKTQVLVSTESKPQVATAAKEGTAAAPAKIKIPTAAADAPVPAAVAPVQAPTTTTTTKPSSTSIKPIGDDSFTSSLRKIMSSGGGVLYTAKVPIFLDLMNRAASGPQRIAISQMLINSSVDVQREIVLQKGLLILQKWVTEAISGKREKVLLNVMSALDALPVTLAALQPPCELGRLMGKLRRAPGFETVQPKAVALVSKWRAIVEQSETAPIAQAAAVAAAATAKVKSADAEAKVATAKRANLTAAAAAAASSKGAKSEPAPKKARITPTSTTLGAPSVSTAPPVKQHQQQNALVGGDEDIFGVADKKRAGNTAAATAVATTSSIAATTPTSVAPTISNGIKPRHPVPAAAVTLADASDGAKKTIPTTTTTTSSIAPPPPGARSTSSSLFASSSLASGGAASTRALPTLITGPERARLRAKEAAARIPSPEPQPRGATTKEKRKKVSWVMGDALEAVRFFWKQAPPADAAREAEATPPAVPVVAAAAAATATAPSSATKPSSATDGEVGDPFFASAAKKEHINEAEALRRHREEEEEDHVLFRSRLEAMIEDVLWEIPPLVAISSATLSIAAGDESTEVEDVVARRVQQALPPAIYPTPESIPHCPLEPLHGVDRGRHQPLHQIPRIPLTNGESVAAAAVAAPALGIDTAPPHWQQQQQQRDERRGTPQYHSLPPPPQHQREQRHQQQANNFLPDKYSSPAPPAAAPAVVSIEGISSILSQLTATGALPPLPQQPPLPQHHHHYGQRQQPPPQRNGPSGVRGQKHHHRPELMQNGMPIMLGLHKRPPTTATAAAADEQPSQQQQHSQPAPPHPLGGARGRAATPCRFFASRHGCRNGDKCPFSHALLPTTDVTITTTTTTTGEQQHRGVGLPSSTYHVQQQGRY